MNLEVEIITKFDEIEGVIAKIITTPFELIGWRTVHFVMSENHLFELQLFKVKAEEEEEVPVETPEEEEKAMAEEESVVAVPEEEKPVVC